jgi:ABC-type Fe3+ transport system substrate-binding protein
MLVNRQLGFLMVAMLPWLAPGQEASVVVISPHNEAIRTEFGRGFSQWHLESFGKTARVEWRDLGGSTDALRFVKSEFESKPDGIGLDCFFGGGQDPFLRLSGWGFALPYGPSGDILSLVPQNWNGVEIYDKSHRWHGTALSTFGILQNLRLQETMGLPPVARWQDLAQPALYGWIGAGDPRNSGSMSAIYETILQAFGWEKGWQLLAQIGGNVRRFDRFSSNTAKDVTLGETYCGLAIDFYAFSQVSYAGPESLAYVLPEDAAVVIPDGIALLKGAPHLETAQRFVDFVLSEPGQKLWFIKRGLPGGTQIHSIERMSIRPDFYRRFRTQSNIRQSPFDLKQSFRYDGQLARRRSDVVAALVGALLVDTHPELQKAWRSVLDRGGRAGDIERLGHPALSGDEALRLAEGEWKDTAARIRIKLDWQRWARDKYRQLYAPGH